MGLLITLGRFPANANTIAIDFTDYFAQINDSQQTRGWDFTVNSSILVTDLGVWDANNTVFKGSPGDGLTQPLTVSLWDNASQLLLAQATVPSGTTGALVDDFRYAALLTPVQLDPGHTYVVSVFYPQTGDPDATNVTGISTAPEINYGSGRSTQFGFPNSVDANNGYFGPNFQFIAAPGNGVPETGASGMLLAGSLGGIFGLRLVRRHRLG